MRNTGFSLKPCKICNRYGHSKMSCPMKRKSRLGIGKHTIKDRLENRKFRESRLNHQGYLICENCGSWYGSDTDHIKKKGSNPHLRYEKSNKQILCRSCHNKKDNT